MVTFAWTNAFYQEEEFRAACVPSQVSRVSDETFNTADNREGSLSLVPSSLLPGYPTLSPHPPQLTLELESDSELEQEDALPVPSPILTLAPSNTLHVQQILQ